MKVSGTGCSRMAFELAKRGFEIEASDFCFIYILCDDYLFNYSHKNEFQFYPSIHTFANNVNLLLLKDIHFLMLISEMN